MGMEFRIMISQNKLEADRRNAQLSTGPTSPEGRKAVSRNAVTHGLRARHVVTLAERPAEFERLCADLEAEWDPQTHAERFLVEQLAVIQWKLGRWEAVESAAVLQSTTVCLAFHDLREYETERNRPPPRHHGQARRPRQPHPGPLQPVHLP